MSAPSRRRLDKRIRWAASWPAVILASLGVLVTGIALGTLGTFDSHQHQDELDHTAGELVTPPTGRLLVLRDGAVQITTQLGDVLTRLPAPDLRMESVSPDLSKLALVGSDGGTVAVMDIPEGHMRVVIADPASLYGYARWSSDSRYLYFVRTPRSGSDRDAWDILRADVAKGRVERVTPREGATFDQVTPLPDGRIVFESQTREIPEPMTLYIANADGRDARPLLGTRAEGLQCASLDVSPDGRSLAVACADYRTMRFFVLLHDLQSGAVDELAAPVVQPRWIDSEHLVAVNLYSYNECPDAISWIDRNGGVTVSPRDFGAYVHIVGVGNDNHLLVERRECTSGRGSETASILWVNRTGQTFRVGDAEQALWWRR